jgi:hypothetical protein
MSDLVSARGMTNGFVPLARAAASSLTIPQFYVLIRLVTPPKKSAQVKADKNPKIIDKSSIDTIATPAHSQRHGHPGTRDARAPRACLCDGPLSPSEAALSQRLLAAPAPEPDGATLHRLAISVMRFKLGRISVPPAIVLASGGLHRPSPLVPLRTRPARLTRSACGRACEFRAFAVCRWCDGPNDEHWRRTRLERKSRRSVQSPSRVYRRYGSQQRASGRFRATCSK